jgi:hypothetical protein
MKLLYVFEERAPIAIPRGLQAVPASSAEMLRGDNLGEMLVQLSPDLTLGRP